jgi:hypothetical protein
VPASGVWFELSPKADLSSQTIKSPLVIVVFAPPIYLHTKHKKQNCEAFYVPARENIIILDYRQ